MTTNPFNIGFGQEPYNLIERTNEFNEIITTFSSDAPETRTYILTGPRGCGKTVLMTQIAKHLNKNNNFLTIDLNQYGNILEQLAANLYDRGKMKHLFLEKEFSFSFHGLSFSIKGRNPIVNIDSLLDVMFAYLKKKRIKVLITVDDVSNNSNIKLFAHSFQRFVRENYLVCLLMTGLYENVSSLTNTKNLTFLLRAPKIRLSSLNLKAIAQSYQEIFKISENESVDLAKITKGYAYGYQLLGNLVFKDNCKKLTKSALLKFDNMLEDNVYMKTWTNFSETEKRIMFAMVKSNRIKDIIKLTKLNNSAIQVYKRRLSDAGVVDLSTRGTIAFALPRFGEFVIFQKKLLG
ncbi:MAG: AAA family ATPase [Bacilli bacterium]|nr:AAA family ATPase [Bacilli bacterium]